MSRGLGDFVFKKNPALSQENQIMTANPDITLHDITEDDEFLVLACDGKLRSYYLIHQSFPHVPTKAFGNACRRRKLSTLSILKFPKARSSAKSANSYAITV